MQHIEQKSRYLFMKQLSLFLLITIIFLSCQKSKKEYTTNFQDSFITSINLSYDQTANKTYVSAVFYHPEITNGLKLPTDCYIKVNDVQLILSENNYWYDNSYHYNLDGKPDCLIEFKDADGIIYKNTVTQIDTVYFINLQENVSSSEDLNVQINSYIDADALSIYLDYGGDYFTFAEFQVDSSIIIPSSNLTANSWHELSAHKLVSHKNPNLPKGNGYINVKYILNQSIKTD